MITIKHSKRKLILEFPECEVCRDFGGVDTPTIRWNDQLFLGHGRCDCFTCQKWPLQARLEAECTGRMIPQEAMEAVEAGRAGRHMTVMPCPFCENGEHFRDWQKGEPFWVIARKDGTKYRIPFRPLGWITLGELTEEGKQYIALWEEKNGATTEDARQRAMENLKRHRMGLKTIPSNPVASLRNEKVEETPQQIAAAQRLKEQMRNQVSV